MNTSPGKKWLLVGLVALSVSVACLPQAEAFDPAPHPTNPILRAFKWTHEAINGKRMEASKRGVPLMLIGGGLAMSLAGVNPLALSTWSAMAGQAGVALTFAAGALLAGGFLGATTSSVKGHVWHNWIRKEGRAVDPFLFSLGKDLKSIAKVAGANGSKAGPKDGVIKNLLEALHAAGERMEQHRTFGGCWDAVCQAAGVQ